MGNRKTKEGGLPIRAQGLRSYFRVAFGLTQNQMRHRAISVNHELRGCTCGIEYRFRLWDQRKGVQVQPAVDQGNGLGAAREPATFCGTPRNS
jgi:hypothetical protein